MLLKRVNDFDEDFFEQEFFITTMTMSGKVAFECWQRMWDKISQL